MDARWFAEDNVQYYATDHLGSTNFTFDSEQNLISHAEYFPSGEVWRNETVAAYAGLNPYSFTGKEWDATTGLYDFGARQYDPRLGQWLSPDPAFDGLNLYAYVHNNPVKLVDPFGLTAEVRGEDSQITWSNRTRDDNGVTSHYENGDFHDPYRDSGEDSAPSYSDVTRDAYDAARNEQRAEAYGRAQDNDWAKLRNEPLDYKGFTPEELEMMINGVMLAMPTGVGAASAASAGRYVFRAAVAQRAAYHTVVRNLDDLGVRLLDAGASPEQVARILVPLRNAAKENIRTTGPAILKWSAEVRNLLKYGDKLGPSADQLRKAKGSWEAVVEGTGRTNAQLDRLLGGG